MAKRSFFVASSFVAVGALVGCIAPEEAIDEREEQSSNLTTQDCADVSGTDFKKSIAITDPTVLTKFTFTRVMNQVRTSANVGAGQTSTSVWKDWMDTFGKSTDAGDCDDADPNKYGLVCPRPNEQALGSINPFAATGMVPVGLFNRFDLAPSNGANCGEYRIVFALKSQNPGRAFIIFEGALANPTPALGIEACFPVAKFWQGLTANTSAQIAAKLDKFYFTGGAVTGFPAVVNASSYGLATDKGAATAGQIRTNFFVGGSGIQEWELREFKTHRACTNAADPKTCTLDMKLVPVKANPANELFKGTHTKSDAFQTAFIKQIPALARGDLSTIGLSTATGFNELESVAQRTDVIYSSQTEAAFKTEIQTKLTAMKSTLTPKNILDRATTQTCAGCHQLSPGTNLGGGLTWPQSNVFTQIDEGGRLSPALTGTFIPHRIKVLEKFINDRCVQSNGKSAPPPAAVDDELTVGGSAVGGAN